MANRSCPTTPRGRRNFRYLAITTLLIETALTLKIVGLMAPLPVQWQWPFN